MKIEKKEFNKSLKTLNDFIRGIGSACYDAGPGCEVLIYEYIKGHIPDPSEETLWPLENFRLCLGVSVGAEDQNFQLTRYGKKLAQDGAVLAFSKDIERKDIILRAVLVSKTPIKQEEYANSCYYFASLTNFLLIRELGLSLMAIATHVSEKTIMPNEIEGLHAKAEAFIWNYEYEEAQIHGSSSE